MDEGSIGTFWASHPAEDRTSRSARLAFACVRSCVRGGLVLGECIVLRCNVSNMRRAGRPRVPKFETFAEIARQMPQNSKHSSNFKARLPRIRNIRQISKLGRPEFETFVKFEAWPPRIRNIRQISKLDRL